MKTFEELGINPAILKVIEEDRFEEPSEIQEKAIPLVIKGKDVIGGSATGSGKTLVFAAGIIQHVQRGKGIQSLILTPTRELAEQVSSSIKHFSKYKPLNIAAIYGGVSISPQIEQLKHADIVIGTPGRVLDHLDRRTINLYNIKILVLDEADRMLDMGFIYDVEKIIKQCPEKRQTLLFSATISSDIDHIAKKFLSNPTEVSAESYVDPSLLKQYYYDVPDNLKFSLLVHLLKNEHADLVMVFCNSRSNVDFVAKNLELQGINALAVHGGLTQDKRTRTMKEFHSKNTSVLVCTDVAARGLHIQDVSHVYNYDIPKDSKEYIHRIGRTARAGEEGKALSILSSRDYENFQKVLKDDSLKIQRLELPNVERVFIKTFQRGRFSGRFSRGNFRERGEGRGSGERSEGEYRKDRPQGRYYGRRNASRRSNTGREDGRSFSSNQDRRHNPGRGLSRPRRSFSRSRRF